MMTVRFLVHGKDRAEITRNAEHVLLAFGDNRLDYDIDVTPYQLVEQSDEPVMWVGDVTAQAR